MSYVWATLFICLLVSLQALHIFTLPANWVCLTLIVAWKWLHPEGAMTWLFIAMLLLLALAGEAAEFWAQLRGAKKYGASGTGNFGGILGAIAGAIIGAPFLLGLGALLGALAGAWLGCLAFELIRGKPMAEARRAAVGAFWGKAFGMTLKVCMGAVMIILSVPYIWP